MAQVQNQRVCANHRRWFARLLPNALHGCAQRTIQQGNWSALTAAKASTELRSRRCVLGAGLSAQACSRGLVLCALATKEEGARPHSSRQGEGAESTRRRVLHAGLCSTREKSWHVHGTLRAAEARCTGFTRKQAQGPLAQWTSTAGRAHSERNGVCPGAGASRLPRAYARWACARTSSCDGAALGQAASRQGFRVLRSRPSQGRRYYEQRTLELGAAYNEDASSRTRVLTGAVERRPRRPEAQRPRDLREVVGGAALTQERALPSLFSLRAGVSQ